MELFQQEQASELFTGIGGVNGGGAIRIAQSYSPKVLTFFTFPDEEFLRDDISDSLNEERAQKTYTQAIIVADKRYFILERFTTAEEERRADPIGDSTI